MLRRSWPILLSGLMALAAWLAGSSTASAEDPMRLYHWPFRYTPPTYWPNLYRWPDPRLSFQPPPPYMAYPLQRDNWYRYEILENRRYHRGFHFFLDQF